MISIAKQNTSTSDSVRRSYDRLAEDYDRRWNFYVNATLEAVLQVACPNASERVLDLACGTGALGERIVRQWPTVQVVGVDVSFAMLQQAATKFALHDTHWCQAESNRLPFRDAAFDLVICANSFHYFHHASKALAEVHRLLRPGGTFIVVDWCDDYFTCKLCSLWLRLRDPAFHQMYSQKACERLLTDAHFEITDSTKFRINWLWGLMRFVCRRPS